MWRSILAGLIASGVGYLTAAYGEPVGPKANPHAVSPTGKNVGGGDPGVRVAQTAREQHATNVPQISYNIVTDGGAACNGGVGKDQRGLLINPLPFMLDILQTDEVIK